MKTTAVIRMVGPPPMRSASRAAPMAPIAAPTSSRLVTSSFWNEVMCAEIVLQEQQRAGHDPGVITEQQPAQRGDGCASRPPPCSVCRAGRYLRYLRYPAGWAPSLMRSFASLLNASTSLSAGGDPATPTASAHAHGGPNRGPTATGSAARGQARRPQLIVVSGGGRLAELAQRGAHPGGNARAHRLAGAAAPLPPVRTALPGRGPEKSWRWLVSSGTYIPHNTPPSRNCFSPSGYPAPRGQTRQAA